MMGHDHTASSSGGSTPLPPPEGTTVDSSKLLEVGIKSGGHEHPEDYELDSASRTDSSSRGPTNSVKKVVDRFEAAAAAVLPTHEPARKPWRWTWSEKSDQNTPNLPNDLRNQRKVDCGLLTSASDVNSDEKSDQNVPSLRFQQQVDRNVDNLSSKNAKDSDLLCSDASGEELRRLSTSVASRKVVQSRGLSRAQSAREDRRSQNQHQHDDLGRDHNSNNGGGKSAVLSRAKSVSMVAEVQLRAGRAAVFGWIADIKSKLESNLERTFSSSATFRHSSSISPMPTTVPSLDARIDPRSQMPRLDTAKKSPGTISFSPPVSRESSISPMSILDDGEAALQRDISKKSERADEDLGDSEQSPIEQVALIVPTTDDSTIPVWTFRTAVLGTFSCILITFLNTYFSYRTEPIVITVTTVLIAAAPLGKFMASTLPDRFVRIPGTRRGFSLNPGPFNMKEHTLITIFASAGSVRPGGVFVVNMIKVFFHGHIGFLPGFLLILTCELFGYSWSVLLYKFLVEPARFWFPGSLVNVSLVRALNLDEKKKGISLISFFVICFSVACAYYVIPGFFVPSVSSVSVICLIFKHNVLAQQLGSGSRGLGLGAISFDWATISSFQGSPLVVPWVAVVNIVAGFVIQAYLVAPITYWKNWFHSKNYPIFSSDIFTRSGELYDVSRVLNQSHSQLRRNNEGLRMEDLPHFSAFYTLSTGFTFALFGAVCSQVIFFNGRDLLKTFQAAITSRPTESPDVHMRLMEKYPAIPMRWCWLLFLGTHIAAIVNLVVYKDQLQMKWWGIFLSDAVTAVMVLPICIMVATTNQLPNLGILSQYIMGFIRAGEPITNVMFRTYSTVVCGRTGTFLGNFKFGHYMKIPPRASFYGQLIGTFISALVSMVVVTWLTESIDDICDVTRLPKNTPWTCPQDRVFFDQAVSFGIAGTRRLFTKKNAPYRTLNYYFLPGFFLPFLLWLLTIAMPRVEWLRLLNGPLIVRGASLMPPSPVVNNAMWIYVALFFGFYVFHYKKAWWQRYNFVLSAALDAGTVFMALLLYYSLDEGKKSLHWWGRKEKGDHCPLASCPTAPGVHKPGCPTF